MKKCTKKFLNQIVDELFREDYTGLSEEEYALGIKQTVENLSNDEEFEEVIKQHIRSAMYDVYYGQVYPKHNTKFNSKGVVLTLDDKKIELKYRKTIPVVKYNGNIFPAYWYRKDLDEMEIVDKLKYLLDNLPYEEIKFPYLQIWSKLDTWHREGFSDELLTEMEKTLESYSDETNSEETEYLMNSFYAKKPVYYLEWPNWVDSVESFDFTSMTNDKLRGRLTLNLLNSKKCVIDIEATKRNFRNVESWDVNSMRAVNRGFPKFTERDKNIINNYLTDNFK